MVEKRQQSGVYQAWKIKYLNKWTIVSAVVGASDDIHDPIFKAINFEQGFSSYNYNSLKIDTKVHCKKGDK